MTLKQKAALAFFDAAVAEAKEAGIEPAELLARILSETEPVPTLQGLPTRSTQVH